VREIAIEKLTDDHQVNKGQVSTQQSQTVNYPVKLVKVIIHVFTKKQRANAEIVKSNCDKQNKDIVNKK
jgi:hypothetical protein